jgi:hypothetical protein
MGDRPNDTNRVEQMSRSADWLPGVHQSLNIQADPETYEIENRAIDPEGRIETAMRSIADWAGRDLLDLGTGTGYQIPAFAASARHVFAIEPDDHSRLAAMETMRPAPRPQCVGARRLGRVDPAPRRFGRRRPRSVRLLLGTRLRARDRRGSKGSSTGRDGFRRRQRPAQRHVRVVAASRAIERRPRCRSRRGILDRPGLRPDAHRVRLAFREPRRPRAGRALELPERLVPELLAEVSGLEVDYHYALYSRTF